MKSPFAQTTRKLLITSIAAMSLFTTGNANAGPLNISDAPLDTVEGVPANIIFIMDDSTSMQLGYLPEDIDGDNDTLRGRANEYNSLYYSPFITYTPAVDKDGISLGDASFTAAWINGFDQGGATRNLSTSYRVNWFGGYNGNQFPALKDDVNNGTLPAYYYYFDTSKDFTPGVPCDINDLSPTGHVNGSDTCYTRVTVSTTSGVSYDPASADPLCVADRGKHNRNCYITAQNELQNFANWYSYYRLRDLASRTAATKAFASLSDQVRISWAALNTNPNSPADPLPFTGSHREDFFTFLGGLPTSTAIRFTPLRNALKQAGDKYSQTGPYEKEPGVAGTPQYSCRQNFSFMFTDGNWNRSFSAVGNKDNSSFGLPPAPKYGAAKTYNNTQSQTANNTPPIYRGADSNMLADIALYYWGRDLSPLDNDVPVYEADTTTDIDNDGTVTDNDIFWNPKNDPAQWQHMVSFFVGLGVDGALDFDGTTTSGSTYDDLMKGPSGGGTTWGSDKTDDLWHAAINGRGEYFSASDPEELTDSFTAVLNNIDNVRSSASSSAIATTSSELRSGGVIYQTLYDPSTWAGNIFAYDATLVPGDFATSTPAQLITALKWSASDVLEVQATGGSGRQIVTFDTVAATGIPFQWSDLNAAQQAELNAGGLGNDRLTYLRGDRTNELANGGAFRDRDSLYGDFVHADPIYVTKPGPPVTVYPDSLESSAYSTFVNSYKTRKDLLLTGANDGMLHILDATTGNEIMGYIPSPVFRNLDLLTEPAYSHKYYVDQTVRVEDIYDGTQWRTVAIGGMGKGGQGIYALDITNPTNLTEANAATAVMWEFTDADDADLGYSYTRPQIFKMNNGKWMVGFNNGYNSTEDDTAAGGQMSASGNGIMYFIDVATGGQTTTVKLDTKVGTTGGRANRLTDFVAIDTDNNYTIDYVYAGDLFGNVWKIDVSSSNSNQWKVMGTGATPKPIFVATDPGGIAQPITQELKVAKHRTKNGYLVYFGTGKFLELADRTDTQIQSIYAFWDREESSISTPITREHLLQQWIDFEGVTLDTDGTTDISYRTSTNNATKVEYNRYVIDWHTTGGFPAPADTTRLGWHIDLGLTGDITNPTILVPDGERIDNHLSLQSVGDGVIEFTTFIPTKDPCDSGGVSWTYRLDPFTGNRGSYFRFLDGTVLEAVNSDGQVVKVSAAKRTDTPRYRSTKTWDTFGGECTEVNIINASDGTIGVTTNECSNKGLGRRSWRQIHIK